LLSPFVSGPTKSLRLRRRTSKDVRASKSYGASSGSTFRPDVRMHSRARGDRAAHGG
jgi:hypothetical protein